jgi:hypothetical protein
MKPHTYLATRSNIMVQRLTFRSSAPTASNAVAAEPTGWRHALWLALLVAASVAFTFGFACAVPFAAFGTVAAMTLNRRDALGLICAVWLANQIVGFTVLGYPWTGMTFVWGGILGVVAILSTLGAQWVAGERRTVTTVLRAFACAFAIYEGALFAVSAGVMGGTEDFVPSIVLRILAINAAAFAGLLVVNQLAATVGFATKLAFPLSMAGRQA